MKLFTCFSWNEYFYLDEMVICFPCSETYIVDLQIFILFFWPSSWLFYINGKQHLWGTRWGQGQGIWVGNELGLWGVKPPASEGNLLNLSRSRNINLTHILKTSTLLIAPMLTSWIALVFNHSLIVFLWLLIALNFTPA